MFYFVYFVFFLISLVYSFFSKKIHKISIFLFFLIVSIFVFFKNSNVPDYDSYIKIFDSINIQLNYGFDFFNKNYSIGVEYGFLYVIKYFKIIVGNYPNLFYAIFSFIISIITFYSLKKLLTCDGQTYLASLDKSREKIILFIIYISYFGFCYNIVALRAGFAMAITMLITILFLDKKYYIIPFVFLLGFSIQRMCILCIPIILIFYKFPFNKKIYKIIWIIMGILLFLNFSYYFCIRNYSSIVKFVGNTGLGGYTSYLNSDALTSKIALKDIYIWLIGALLLWTSSFNLYEERFFKVYFFGVMISVLLSAFQGAGRIYDFFIIYNIPLIYLFYKHSTITAKHRQLLCILIVIINCLLSFRITGGL